jgi:hypothetical protein
MENLTMKFFKSLFLGFIVLVGGCLIGQGQTQPNTLFVQSFGPISALTACTAATGVATSIVNTPCGGQGSMFQNSLVTSMTLNWTDVATVSACTIQLEQSTTLTGTYTLLGTAQTCTSSGSYTATLSAAYVRVNITSLTTTGSGSFQFNYYGQLAQAPQSILTSASYCALAVCVPAFQTNFRIVYGICTAAASANCVVTGIAPPFTSVTSFVCTAANQTTAANYVEEVANTSTSSITITAANSSSNPFGWQCSGT